MPETDSELEIYEAESVVLTIIGIIFLQQHLQLENSIDFSIYAEV